MADYTSPTAYAPAGCGSLCTTGDSCGTGGCGGYSIYPDSGCYAYDSNGCGPTRSKRQWFAGVYGLIMQRNNPDAKRLGIFVPTTPAAYPYYPDPTAVTYFTTGGADFDTQGGAEIRFGSTFGRPGCDCTGARPFAWEAAYWALDDNSQSALITDTFGGTTRMYSNVNYAGSSTTATARAPRGGIGP